MKSENRTLSKRDLSLSRYYQITYLKILKLNEISYKAKKCTSRPLLNLSRLLLNLLCFLHYFNPHIVK